MRRFCLMVALAVPWLLLTVGFTTWALDEEERSCTAVCSEAKDQCVASCGAHDNPKECEARCQEEEQNCIRQCESH